MAVNLVSKVFTYKVCCDRRPPWETRPDGTVVFKPKHNRDSVGTDMWGGKPVVTISNRGKSAKVFGFFDSHGVVLKENAVPSGKGVILHLFGGVTEFHTFTPLESEKAVQIKRKLNSGKKAELDQSGSERENDQ